MRGKITTKRPEVKGLHEREFGVEYGQPAGSAARAGGRPGFLAYVAVPRTAVGSHRKKRDHLSILEDKPRGNGWVERTDM